MVQGSKDKVIDIKKIIEKYNVKLEEVAFIGDDLNDFEAMKIVGVRGCPSDAEKEIKELCEFVAANSGGEGAVRDFVEWLKCQEQYGRNYTQNSISFTNEGIN